MRIKIFYLLTMLIGLYGFYILCTSKNITRSTCGLSIEVLSIVAQKKLGKIDKE